MAKKQITAASSPAEIKAAQEELSKAQKEFNTVFQQKFSNKSYSVNDLSKEAQSITSKYDYVDYGQLPSVGNEINIGGDQFFVKGLNNQTNSVSPPAAKTIVNSDDAFPVTKPTTAAPTVNTNPKVNNPAQTKLDQNIANETSPVTATQSPQVTPNTTQQTIGSKDATQAGAALESNSKAQSNQSGIINQNPNELPTTNNLPGRLSDEFVKEPGISNTRKGGNTDDVAKKSGPMGMSFTGASNQTDTIMAADAARQGSAGTVTIGSNNGIPVPESTPGTKNRAGINVRSNLLHEYANWTYKLAWYMLDNNTYNSLISSGDVTPGNEKLIARSGGVGSQLQTEMAGDVYFRSLRVTSVIGNRQEGAATNNVEMEMTIVEPYGASLIGELAAMAVNMTGEQSISPSEVPYLLEIDFAGYKDDGTMIPSILGTNSRGKKYIPVKILTVEMSLQATGTVYVMTMAPYSFYAQTSRYADIEFGVTLKGKTLQEMLGDQSGGLMRQLNLWEDLKTRESKVVSVPDEYAIEVYSFDSKGTETGEMLNSPFAYPGAGGDQTIMKTRGWEGNAVNGSTYTIPRGSIIKDVIKNIVMHSQYFNLRMDPKKPFDEKRAAELIKIIPVIELLPTYDKARNEFAKKITFKVFNTLNFGEGIPGVGNAPVSTWGYSKEYNWLFTGKNADIIDANLVYNMIYYTKMETNVTDQNTIKLGQTADGIREWADQSYTKRGIATKGGSVSSSGANVPERYINATVAAEWFDSKMNSSNTDNVALDLRIIGDPDWIPQDGSIRGGQIKLYSELYDDHESVAVDAAGVYVKLNLRTPRDYNPTTGLMDLRSDQLTIQGVYQVITVESTFEDGKFTQVLKMVKVPNQEEEKPRAVTASEFRRNEANPFTAGQLDNTIRAETAPTSTNNSAVTIGPSNFAFGSR